MGLRLEFQTNRQIYLNGKNLAPGYPGHLVILPQR
jgi:hypothetical protein